MHALRKRLSALEAKGPDSLRNWHRIICWEGQTEAEATAAYETEHGPINDNDGRVLRVIIHKPSPQS